MANKGNIERGAARVSAERLSTVMAIDPGALTSDVREAFIALLTEIDELGQALGAAQRRICELEDLVETDELTPTRNRRGLLRDLVQALADIDRHGLSAAIVFIDVDRLKQINDSFGHAVGDAVLVHVGETLKANLRESDSVARLGGDEFAVILRHVTPAQAQTKTKELRHAIAGAPVTVHGHQIVLSISAGFQMLARGQNADMALSAADRAMYLQKLTPRA